MFQSQYAKLLSTILAGALWSALFFTPTITLGAKREEGICADLPPGGELRIENRRGRISVEVWEEKHISVSAVTEGARPKRSPVVIKRTEKLLSISVLGAPARRPLPRVDLSLRIPERSRAEILTINGEITVKGIPETLTVRTVSGDVYAEFPETAGADIRAESVNGEVASSLSGQSPARASNRLLELRMGEGGRPVRLSSTRGRITLLAQSLTPGSVRSASVAPEREETSANEARKPPTLLIPGSGSSGVGAGRGAPAAPSATPQEVGEDDVIRVDTELVTLNVSVVERGTNRGFADLTASDFKLYEDGAEQRITHFESSAAPFNMVLLIDLSTSTREVINLIRGAALSFVAAARPADRIAVITFAGEPVVVSTLTTDREALGRRINAIEQPRGSTRLYDSLDFAMKQVLKGAKDSRRNAIVLMSDGLDSALPNVTGDGSTLDYNELLGRVREFDGVLYALWLNTEYEAFSPEDVQPETFDLAYDRMKELADAGGGSFYEVEKLENLAGAYERVVADLGTVYSLSYRPTNKVRDGKWRAIRVSVARPGAVARGKRGYYAN